jgi:site-specific DNA recombinase
MKAAIYGRVSKDEDNSDSVAVQLRACRELAKQRGLTVVAEHEDDGISGWSTGNRPGFQALMQAARAGQIDVILFRDIERLARGPDLPVVCRQLEFHRCALLGLDKSDSSDASFRMRIGLSAIMSSEMIEKVRVLTRGALQDRAREGHSTGGAAYGYRSAPIDPANPDGRRHLVIEETEACVVRRIFEWYADGVSPRKIAARLNAEGVPSPGARWKRTVRRRDGKWLASAVHGDVMRGSGILNNARYVGRIAYGRRQFVKNPDTGVRVVRAGDERIEFTDERLRIVPQGLWDRVKGRQGHQRTTVGGRIKGAIRRNAPGQGRPPRYLLSGLLQCGLCDAGMTMADDRAYVCASHKNGAACTNGIRVARTLAEVRILASVKRDLRDPAVIAEVERRYTMAIAARAKNSAKLDQSVRIAELERQISNLADAIASGLLRSSPVLAQRLAAAEAELERLKSERQQKARVIARIAPKVSERFLVQVDELEVRLGQDPERSRPALIEAIGDRIILKPDVSGRFLWAEYGLQGERLLAAVGMQEIMVAGAGFEPATFGL